MKSKKNNPPFSQLISYSLFVLILFICHWMRKKLNFTKCCRHQRCFKKISNLFRFDYRSIRKFRILQYICVLNRFIQTEFNGFISAQIFYHISKTVENMRFPLWNPHISFINVVMFGFSLIIYDDRSISMKIKKTSVEEIEILSFFFHANQEWQLKRTKNQNGSLLSTWLRSSII